MNYFVVAIDYGRRGIEAIVDPEITRREVVSRLRSGEYRDVSFIHHIHDGICEVVTDELIEAAGMPEENVRESAPEQRAVTPAVDYAALRESHYQAALDAGKKLSDAKLANKKMKDIRFLESQHQQAWSRVYAMDAIIRERAAR